jgi:hypothetical protein
MYEFGNLTGFEKVMNSVMQDKVFMTKIYAEAAGLYGAWFRIDGHLELGHIGQA